MYNLGRVIVVVSRSFLEGVLKVSGMYLEGVWNVSGRCLEGNWSLTMLLCGLVFNEMVRLPEKSFNPPLPRGIDPPHPRQLVQRERKLNPFNPAPTRALVQWDQSPTY